MMLNVVFDIAVITVIIYIPKAWLSISTATVQIKPVHWVGRILGGIYIYSVYVCVPCCIIRKQRSNLHTVRTT